MASKLTAGTTASGLHCLGGMMARIVGLLAVVLLAGCGVGADESYADLGVASSGQALEQTQQPSDAPSTAPQAPETTAPVPTKDPGQVALPQDPIPVYVGKPTPQPMPGMTADPGFEGPLPVPAPPPLP